MQLQMQIRNFPQACTLDLEDAPLNLPNTTTVRANLGSSCTAINLCMNGGNYGRNFHAYVEIDPCSYQIVVGIEDLFVNRTLERYSWGKTTNVLNL